MDRNWPHDKPDGWNLNAAKFVELLQSQPMMWLKLSQAKYVELRIDTRDGGFNLYDRDQKPLNPDDVVRAIEEANEDFGSAPYRKSDSKIVTGLKEAVAVAKGEAEPGRVTTYYVAPKEHRNE